MRKQRKLLCLFSLFLWGLPPAKTIAQQDSHLGINIQTPNAASIGRFGEIPVNMATGSARINVPIYELSLGDTKIPIELNYHTGGIAIESHPSWTGLGWTLNCGGAITRVVKGGIDDFKTIPTPGSGPLHGYFTSGHVLNTSNWQDHSYIAGITQAYSSPQGWNPNYMDDGEPDEFYFNMGNMNGSFMRNEQGQWIVKSDADIDFEVQHEINTSDFILNSVVTTSAYVKLYHLFVKFTITDGKGYKYIFGGDENSIEFTRGGMGQYSLSQGYALYVTPQAWYLTKVIAPTGEEIVFNYEKGKALFQKTSSYGGRWTYRIDNSNTCGGNSFDRGATATNPVYLKSIESRTQRLEFERSGTEELKYHDLPNEDNSLNPSITAWPDLSYAQTNASPHDKSFQHNFQQLNVIRLIDKQTGAVKRNFRFYYSEDPNVRLTLNTIEMPAGNAISGGEKYQFQYNDVAGLPPYYSMESDFWGFYNGKNYYLTGPYYTFPDWRPVDAQKAAKGVLKKITYPTGGYTEFEFEPNEYSQYLNYLPFINLQNNLNNATLQAGGLRIKKVTSTAGFNAPALVKEYFYKNNYAGGGSTSSGILGGKPFFYDEIKTHSGCMGSGTVDFATVRINDMAMHPISQTGTPAVNYSEVTEKNADGSYIVHKFSNFDNGAYLDELVNNPYLHPDVFAQNSYQLNSLALERGKLLQKDAYSSTGQKVLSTSYEYNTDPNRKNNFVKALRYHMPMTSCQCAVNNIFTGRAWPYKIYYYHHFLKKETQTEYFNGTNVVNVTDYEYDKYRNVVSVRKTGNNSETIVEKIRYNSNDAYLNSGNTTDYNCIAFSNLFNQRRIKSYPVEMIKINESSTGDQRVIEGNLMLYNKDMPAVKEIKRLNIQTPLNANGSSQNYTPSLTNSSGFQANAGYETYATVDAYGPNAEKWQVTEKPGTTSYTWDYSHNLVTSKTVNATRNEIAYTSFEGTYTGISTDPNKGSWYFSATSVVNGGVTGSKCFQLDNTNTMGAGLVPGQKYIVSFWTNSTTPPLVYNTNNPANPSMFISVSMTALTTVNGWTQFRAIFNPAQPGLLIKPANSSTVHLIDEIRLHPMKAQMSSYTYDPVFGMISQNNPSGFLTFYEYDGFGRLKLVKDQNGKILKKYEYGIQLAE